MIVRPRLDADAEALVAILARTHALDGYPVRESRVTWDWLVDEILHAWTAAQDDRPIGHVGIAEPVDGSLLPTGSLEVTRLFVDPDVRGAGAAGRLLDVVEGHAVQLDRPLGLEVVAGSEAAIRFYLRRGWTEIGQRAATWSTADGARPTLIGFVAPPAG